jgi:hypothetical protein
VARQENYKREPDVVGNPLGLKETMHIEKISRVLSVEGRT